MYMFPDWRTLDVMPVAEEFELQHAA